MGGRLTTGSAAAAAAGVSSVVARVAPAEALAGVVPPASVEASARATATTARTVGPLTALI
ncbi:hypothetical protein TPA0908_31950 [Micromonospora sp. AKA38]|nr:hypothetical protein TPA0908_31950 [Micromonospora sp. AKA38]